MIFMVKFNKEAHMHTAYKALKLIDAKVKVDTKFLIMQIETDKLDSKAELEKYLTVAVADEKAKFEVR